MRQKIVLNSIEVSFLGIIWKNRSFKNRDNLHYKKAADLVLLSLFMWTYVNNDTQ